MEEALREYMKGFFLEYKAEVGKRGGVMRPTLLEMESYHLFISLGTAFGSGAFIFVMNKKLKHRQAKYIKEILVQLVLCLALFGIGAVAGEMVRTWSFWEFHSFSELIEMMMTDRQGTHFIGRVLFAAWMLPLVYWLAGRFRKETYQTDTGAAYDAVAFYFVIQHMFSRIGCYLNGCCYGKYYAGVGSVIFPTMPVDYPVFPAQLMEVAITAGIFIFLVVRWKKEKLLFGWALVLFGTMIFLSEFFMDQKGVLRIAGINMIQVTALLTILTGVFYIDKLQGRREKVQ